MPLVSLLSRAYPLVEDAAALSTRDIDDGAPFAFDCLFFLLVRGIDNSIIDSSRLRVYSNAVITDSNDLSTLK